MLAARRACGADWSERSRAEKDAGTTPRESSKQWSVESVYRIPMRTSAYAWELVAQTVIVIVYIFYLCFSY